MALLRFDDGQEVEMTQNDNGIVTFTVRQWDGTFNNIYLDKDQAEELGEFLIMFVQQ
jgi:hypothetical protein